MALGHLAGHWLLGSEPTRARIAGRGPAFAAGPNRQAMNSVFSQLSFRFQKHFCLVFSCFFAVLI
jgi:hypothetical protein